jgi:hypothetical protein
VRIFFFAFNIDGRSVPPGYPVHSWYHRFTFMLDHSLNCPECGSANTRLSRQAHAIDVFHRVFGREAYRCRECRCRFYGLKSAAPEMAASHRGSDSRRWSLWPGSSYQRKRLRRGLELLVIFAVAFIIFWFFLRYLTREPDTPAETPASFLLSPSLVQPS